MVILDLDTLQADCGFAETSTGDRITAEQARRLACQAGIIPVVLGGQGEILDLGRTRRLFSTAQRKAMAIRDRECTADGCDIPAAWCEAHHHKKPWSQGGKTDLADGKLLCSFHHHRAHDPGWIATIIPTARPASTDGRESGGLPSHGLSPLLGPKPSGTVPACGSMRTWRSRRSCSSGARRGSASRPRAGRCPSCSTGAASRTGTWRGTSWTRRGRDRRTTSTASASRAGPWRRWPRCSPTRATRGWCTCRRRASSTNTWSPPRWATYGCRACC